MVSRLDRIQRISGALRYLLLLAVGALVLAFALALLVPGQSWITLGDGQLNDLYSSAVVGPMRMFLLAAPFGIILGLGVYWLQRLFSEYQQGHFFTDGTMRCYLWLVWLKAAGFFYGILWPLVFSSLSPDPDLEVNIQAGTLVELILLLLIVHLLKEAQRINDDNKAFV